MAKNTYRLQALTAYPLTAAINGLRRLAMAAQSSKNLFLYTSATFFLRKRGGGGFYSIDIGPRRRLLTLFIFHFFDISSRYGNA